MSANSSPPLGDTPAGGPMRTRPGTCHTHQRFNCPDCRPCEVVPTSTPAGKKTTLKLCATCGHGEATCGVGVDVWLDYAAKPTSSPVSEGTPDNGATDLGPALRAIAVEVERADSSVRRELCAEMLRVLADNTPAHFIVNVGDEAAWSDDPDAVATPSTDAGAGAPVASRSTEAPVSETDPSLADVVRVLTEFAGDESRYAFSNYGDSSQVVAWVTRNAPRLFAANAPDELNAHLCNDCGGPITFAVDGFTHCQRCTYTRNLEHRLTTLHLQHAEQAAKLEELEGYVALIFGADRLAGAVDRLVRSGKLDARSEAGDALLDYAASRHGDREPIIAVRRAYDVILSKLDAARSSPSGGTND